MAGMLPGVELARRRRMHQHQYDRNSREPSLRERLGPSTSMGETALQAHQRLEEKLGGLGFRWNKQQPTEVGGSNHVVQAKETKMGATRLEKVWRLQLGGRRNSEKEVCAVCLEELQAQQQIMNLPCKHRYHSDCLLPWLSVHSHCPCCRSHVKS